MIDTGASLPAADYALLVPLKRSPEYGAVRRRVADLRPEDAWQENDLHFFLFRLKDDPVQPDLDEPPAAVFAMHPASTRPVSAVVVTTRDGFAEVMDIAHAGLVTTWPAG